MLRDDLLKFCKDAKGCKCQVTTMTGHVYEGNLVGCQAKMSDVLKLAKIQIAVNNGIKEFVCTEIENIKKL